MLLICKAWSNRSRKSNSDFICHKLIWIVTCNNFVVQLRTSAYSKITLLLGIWRYRHARWRWRCVACDLRKLCLSRMQFRSSAICGPCVFSVSVFRYLLLLCRICSSLLWNKTASTTIGSVLFLVGKTQAWTYCTDEQLNLRHSELLGHELIYVMWMSVANLALN